MASSKKLKAQSFFNQNDLVDFVNKKGLTKTDIISITGVGNSIHIYFFE